VLASNDSSNGNWTYSCDQFNRLTGANQNSGAAVYGVSVKRTRWAEASFLGLAGKLRFPGCFQIKGSLVAGDMSNEVGRVKGGLE
jgi:hypothetical protein